MNKKRWTWLVISFAVITIILYLFLVLGFPDHWEGDPPPTHFEKIIKILCIVLGFPIVITLIILNSDPPIYIVFLLAVISGIFWGSIIELICVIKDRNKSKHKNAYPAAQADRKG